MMLENFLRALLQILILVIVIGLVYWFGTLVIAAIPGFPAVALLLWQIICALVLLIGVVQVSRPFLPWP